VSRFTPLSVPLLFLGGSFAAMALWPIPAVIDWRIVAFIVVLSAGVMAVETLPLIDDQFGEWGLGAGILAAMLAPFGASVTVLALFSYRAGDLAEGWQRSGSAIPAITAQVLALIAVVFGLTRQRSGRDAVSHLSGRWIVLSATLMGAAAVVAHLFVTAHNIG